MDGYCAITADILHKGHIKFLEECKKRCGKLIVGVMGDEYVKQYKGHYPVMPVEDRIYIVSKLKMVSDVVIQETFEYPEKIARLNYTIFDSLEHGRPGAEILIPYTKGVSSTIIKERIIEAARNRTN